MKFARVMLLGLALVPLAGQETKAESKAPVMAWPKPGPEMAKLKPLMGTWQVEEIHESSPMGPGGRGRGVSRVTAGPGGLSVHIDYQSSGGHMKGFKGHGILAWDAEAKCYKQAWSDNMMATVMVSVGNWEGADFVMHSEGTMLGKPFKSRDRFTGIGPDGYRMVTEFSMDGSPMQKAMTLIHTRAEVPARK